MVRYGEIFRLKEGIIAGYSTMDASNIPSVLHDRTRLKEVPRATRENLRQTAAALLTQIPQITRMYESVVMMLDQIALELEE